MFVTRCGRSLPTVDKTMADIIAEASPYHILVYFQCTLNPSVSASKKAPVSGAFFVAKVGEDMGSLVRNRNEAEVDPFVSANHPVLWNYAVVLSGSAVVASNDNPRNFARA